MPIKGIYANLSCTDLDQSLDWYETLFGRAPDAEPMAGLLEWHMGSHGFQLHKDEAKAGHGTLTLMAGDLTAEWERLTPLAPGALEKASQSSIMRLSDPDGNLVVLAGEA